MATTSERVELITPLGDELLFHGMVAHEELSRLGEYQLDLLSKNKNVDRDKILGAKVAIKVLLETGEVRYFNGFVTRFNAGAALGRYARYYATVSPWLWFLTRTADCRIFQDKTVRQIVEEVFADHPDVADFVFELTDSYRSWTYCVQYRETDFNFVSRLLEHEGMYYYYRHTDGHHTLVVTDSMDKHNATPGYETLQFIAAQGLVRPGTEYVSDWEASREVQPGAYVHRDYDFERPTVDLTTMRTLPRPYTLSNYEMFDYPGAYLQKGDGERYAHVRIDEYGAKFETAQATTNYRGVQVGARFRLEGHEVETVNGEYLVVAATQTLESSQYESGDAAGTGTGFRCNFTALSCSQQFRPPRITPKPFMHGPQTAMVVGPAGDEIYTDKYGRVKVQFHWDRRGKKDENSSCWIRVSHPWAGKGWGSVATPRIGQEVIVDFLEGDPDQPIITGRVYNEETQPPFGFPAGAVQSGIKSATHKGSGYNQLSMDDTAGKEKITIHAQYDMNSKIEHDQTITVVSGNRVMTIEAGTLTDTVKGDASLTIQAGSRTVSVTGGDYSATASNAIILHGKSQGVTVTGDAKGVGITGNGEGVSITGNGKGVGIIGNGEGVGIVGNAKGVGIEGYGDGVSIKGDPDFFAHGISNAAIKSPVVDIGDKEINVIGTKITIAAGASSIVLDAGGVTIQGPLVKIN